jgi:hypothetical protein
MINLFIMIVLKVIDIFYLYFNIIVIFFKVILHMIIFMF